MEATLKTTAFLSILVLKIGRFHIPALANVDFADITFQGKQQCFFRLKNNHLFIVVLSRMVSLF